MGAENSLLTLLFEVCVRAYVSEMSIHTSQRGVFSVVHLNVRKATIITAKLLVTSVTSKKEKNNTAMKVTAGVAGRLPLYPPEMTELKDFAHLLLEITNRCNCMQ
jgi:hypothetical protein